ncbi:MAG: hypothetical protein K2X87_11515 [Gemmataceae bacterium]|nr:hypothetical protein [Gemmataceae bacterium]
MRHTDILALTRVVPFRPFRLLVTTGETFDITHPDMIIPTLGVAHIAVPTATDDPDAPNRIKIVSLVHIQTAEYLSSPAAPPPAGANGTP